MLDLPLSLVAPVKITDASPNGVFYPFRPAGEIMLAVALEKQPHILYLTGDRAFACFMVRPGYPATGAIITDLEFRVDFTSRYDADREENRLGDLLLQGGRASVMAYRADDGFRDPFPMPLWIELNAWSSDEKVGFSKWSIVARDAEKRVTLWPSVKG